MPHLYREQNIPLPLKQAFEFFESPENLKLITPAWLQLEITSGPTEMRVGAEISYSIRWLGIPLRWRTRITEYDPPHRFQDVQLRGPFKVWRHTHLLKAEGEQTQMVDDLEYVLPVGWLGQAVAGWLVRRQLEEMFNYRAQCISRLLTPQTSGSG